MNPRIERILLDMDGVIVNFVDGVCKFHEVPWPFKKGVQGSWDLEPQFGLTAPQLWNPLGREFWANLEPMSHMKEFVAALEARFGQENICLLTSPIRTDGCIDGKMDWIRKHLPQYRRRFLIGPAKQFCASPHHALIDDYEGNIEKFGEAGGNTFLVPAPWNGRFEETPLPALLEWIDKV